MNGSTRLVEIDATAAPASLVPRQERRRAVPQDLGDIDELMTAMAERLAEQDPPFSDQTAARLAVLLSAVQPRARAPHDPHGPDAQDSAA